MAFWSRLRQSQLKTLSYQLKQCHLFNTLNYTALHTRNGIVRNPNLDIQKSQFHFPNNVRSFAAPVQAKKKEEKDTGGPRLNEKITAPVIRLVSDEGHIVLSRHEALERARRFKLDLVEVQRNAQPPVCKLMDFHKEKYKKQVKDKERSKTKSIDVKKGIVKEVRFTGQITSNDLQMKADTVKRLLEEGYRVKCMVTRKKEEDVGKMLERFLVLTEDFSMIESGPRVEEKQAHLILRHVKLGPSKKRDKVPKASKTSSANSQEAAAASAICHSENDVGIITSNLSDDESSWAATDSNDDFDGVFDIGEGENANKSREPISSRSSIDVASTHTASTTVQSPPGRENRYSREPRTPSPPARPIDGYGPGAKNTRLQPPFVDSGKQPQFNINASPQKREGFQREAQASRFTNAGVPANNFSNQNSSGAGASGFGVFSAPRAENTPEKQNGPTEVNNRYQKAPARNSSSTGFSADRNLPVSNSKSRGPINDNDGQGKFGIFSPKTSNVIPNRHAETK